MKNRIKGSIFGSFFGSFFAVVAMLTFAAAAAAQQQGSAGDTVDPYYPALRNKPIPRTADGKPDLSGFWAEWRRVAGLPGPVGRAAAARQREIEASFPLPKESEPMALTPWAAERHVYNKDPLYDRGDRVRNELDPSSHCFPAGTARLGPPFQILQTPGKVFIIYEANHEVRQIFMEGREHPRNLELTWNGHSIGRWDGDTLVVDTIGIRDESWLDQGGHEHSTQLHVVERLRRVDAETLEIERTLTDPIALAKPFTTRVALKFAPDKDLDENVATDCTQFMMRKPAFGEGAGGLMGISEPPAGGY
ncbi:MAG: hypothetical protein IH846_11875 [Acidobacteria bacterium]|nr:hypothetical protein [Acidobacteriota bacterium]